jgi:molybdopterin-guanine dinucleotide biosynthesis protein A
VNRPPALGAIVLAGGRATRLSGADKAQVEVDGRSLLDGVLDAVAGSDPIIVVGPDHLRRDGIVLVRENPPFGGPVAALAAAVAHLSEDADAESWVLACDLPRAAGIVSLLHAVSIPVDADAVVLRDAQGYDQPLAGRYRVPALRRALQSLPQQHGASMRALTAGLVMTRVLDSDGVAVDLDTWAEVEAFRAGRLANDEKETA